MVFTTHKRLMALSALLLVALGFLLMSGGGTENPNEFSGEGVGICFVVCRIVRVERPKPIGDCQGKGDTVQRV